ncbi:MAG: PKD domain-containing protein [Dehalococcoidia bacterium]
MNKLCALLLPITVAFILLATACSAAPQPAATPPTDNETASQPAAQPPIIKGIAGTLEWAPSSKGTLTCVARDPQSTKLTYSWSVDNGTLEGQGSQVTWTAPSAVGDYTVTVKVTNEVGAQATQSRIFKVTPYPLRNEPVEDSTIYLKFLLPSPGPVTVSKRVRYDTVTDIQCTFPNSDPNQITIVWSAPVGKLFGDGIADGTASRVGWLPPGVPGQYTVNVQISDNLGHTATGSVNFDVYLTDQNGNEIEGH